MELKIGDCVIKVKDLDFDEKDVTKVNINYDVVSGTPDENFSAELETQINALMTEAIEDYLKVSEELENDGKTED